MGGTASGQQVQSFYYRVWIIHLRTYEVRVQATGAGTIVASIAEEMVAADNAGSGTNQASTSTDNSITYNGVWSPNEFVIRVRTNNPGASGGNQFRVPTTGGGYNYDVNWGDGTSSTGHTGDATRTYTTAGTYTIQITGTFPRIYFNGGGDDQKIQRVEQWGVIYGPPWKVLLRNDKHGCICNGRTESYTGD